jgi:pentatricopeptide repeat protein
MESKLEYCACFDMEAPLNIGRLQALTAALFVQVTYTTLVDGCVRAGDLFLAEEMLRDMHFTGVPPNTVTFNIMLRGYCQWSDRPIQVCHPTALSLKLHACKIHSFIQRSPDTALCLPALILSLH